MGKYPKQIYKSEKAKQNQDLFRLCREYLDLLDYIYEERYHKYGPDDLKNKTKEKNKIEFFIDTTYKLNICEIGNKCRKENLQKTYYDDDEKKI